MLLNFTICPTQIDAMDRTRSEGSSWEIPYCSASLGRRRQRQGTPAVASTSHVASWRIAHRSATLVSGLSRRDCRTWLHFSALLSTAYAIL